MPQLQQPSLRELAPIAELAQFPLLEAIFGRRARRFGLGMTIPDGPLAYKSAHLPLPLTELERILLVLCGAGISGWNFGIPHTLSGKPNTGCNYPVRTVGKTAPSAAGIYASELLFTDESGTYITQFRDLDPDNLQQFQSISDIDHLVEYAKKHIVQLSPHRVEIPAALPHLETHNFWVANQPGTTLFIPVVDLTQQVLDGLAIMLGQGIVPYDTTYQRTCGDLRSFIKSGLLNENLQQGWFEFEQYLLATAAAEIAIANHNIVLVLQAIGLGGWLYSGINPFSLMGAFADDGVAGFGFRFIHNPQWTAPNPVGLDRYFEGFCPPYHQDMRQAVASFVNLKFGAGGTYDPSRPGPYKENAAVKSLIDRYTPEFIECVSEVAQYIYDTYGKFPATLPSIYARLYAQAQHIDLDFYDQFYGSEAYLHTHASHLEKWH